MESELLERRAETTRSSVRRAYLRFQAHLLAREEERWCPKVDLNIAVSDRDRKELERRIPSGAFSVIPNGVDTRAFQPVKYDSELAADAVFVGGCTWYPNRDALNHFANNILPHLRRSRPNISVRWVGRADPETRKKFWNDFRIELTGYVEDIRPFVHGAGCFIVPIRLGGGTRLKILDAWAMGKAVVSTRQGCEGLAAEDGKNILIRDEEEGFARAIERVLADDELRESLGQAGRKTAEELYSWDVVGGHMKVVYRRLVESSAGNVDLSKYSRR